MLGKLVEDKQIAASDLENLEVEQIILLRLQQL
jgi:hypothetical protein